MRPESSASLNLATFHFVNQLSWDGIAQVIAALGALTAVIVALRIAKSDRDERTEDRRARYRAEARLFLVRGTGQEGAAPDGRFVPGHGARMVFYVEHRGPHPVVDVWYEAWFGNTSGPPSQLHAEVVLPLRDEVEHGHAPPVRMEMPPGAQGLTAWRVRWTDRYGNQWVSHQRNRGGEPEAFRPDAPVVPYS